MKCLSVLALRMGLLLALAAIASPALLRAQISSPVFDPNCYFPRIGVPGEIDTIVGSFSGQRLGAGLVNIGPTPENPGGPGRLMFAGLGGDNSYSAIDMGPNFDPHHMTVAQFKGLWQGSRMVLGHFRTRNITDILLLDSLGQNQELKFYWADTQGLFDTSRFSIPLFQHGNIATPCYNARPPYHAFLTSDSAEDLVLLYNIHVDFVHDSQFYVLFRGGRDIFNPGGYVRSEESVFYDSAHAFDIYYPGAHSFCYSADFRGTGRIDCISSNLFGDLFFYKNEPPFSLLNYAISMRDTFFSVHGEFRIKNNTKWGLIGLPMPVFSRKGPSDFVCYFDSANVEQQLRIFRGGPDFGAHRLTLDSSYTIHCPRHYDNNKFKDEGWGYAFANCGDMTGTGRNVLEVQSSGFLNGGWNFYVLGDALDDKVDMYISELGGGQVDTCTLDGDRLQDVALSSPGYNPEGSASDFKGSVLFVHGSKKIPVRLNRVEVHKTNPALEGAVTVSPNPCSRFTVVTWESSCSGEVHLTLRDLLGKTVYEETRPTTGDLECFRLDLPPLASGEYFLELQQEPCSQIAKIVVKN